MTQAITLDSPIPFTTTVAPPLSDGIPGVTVLDKHLATTSTIDRCLATLVVEHDAEKTAKAAKAASRTQLLSLVGDAGSDHIVEVDGLPRTVTIVPPPVNPTSLDKTALIAAQLLTRKLAGKASADLTKALAKSPESAVKVAERVIGILNRIASLAEFPTKPRKASATVRISG